nr:hypothetical protein CFP56_69691 [Quercus suber]
MDMSNLHKAFQQIRKNCSERTYGFPRTWVTRSFVAHERTRTADGGTSKRSECLSRPPIFVREKLRWVISRDLEAYPKFHPSSMALALGLLLSNNSASTATSYYWTISTLRDTSGVSQSATLRIKYHAILWGSKQLRLFQSMPLRFSSFASVQDRRRTTSRHATCPQMPHCRCI